MSLCCNPLKVVTFQWCSRHDHSLAGFGFWCIIILPLLFGGVYIHTTSPEYIREQQIIEEHWKYLEEMAGCNDLKYELDELLAIREKDRTFLQEETVEYLKPRIAWSCSSEARGVSD